MKRWDVLGAGAHTVAVAVAWAAAAAVAVPGEARAQAAPPREGSPREGSAAEAEARPPRAISLADALAVAVRRNRTLETARIDVAIGEARILASRGVDDWLVDAALSWTSRRSDPVTGLPFQQIAFDGLRFEAGLIKPLPQGGQLGLRLDADYQRQLSLVLIETGGTETTFESESMVYLPALRLEYRQPFLRGFGEDYARAERRRQIAAKEVALLEREATAANVIRDVVQAYWELAYAEQELDIRRQSLQLAREQLRVVRAGIEVGKLAPTEAAAVEAEIAQREEAVLLAEQAVVERALQLRLLTGMEIGPGELALRATDPVEPTLVEPDVDDALQLAMARNPQLRVLAARGRAAWIEVDVAENGLLPQLDFSASAGPTGNADDPGDALGQVARFDNYSVQASLAFSTPIGRRAARGHLEQARGQYRRVKVNEEDVRAQIQVQVVRAVNLVVSARKRIEALAKSEELEKVNVAAEQARFEVGRATTFDLLQRQEALAQAQLRQARAKIDFLNAVATLRALTGEILDDYGVRVVP